MADLTIVVADVQRVSGSTEDGTAGENIMAGQPVYRDPTTDQYFLALASGTDDAEGITQANAKGISLHGALVDQPLRILLQGNYTVGATVIKGGIYCVSTNPGKIAPYADLGSGNYVTELGVAPDATHLNLLINPSTTRRA